MFALKLADIPALVVVSGLKIRSHILFLDVGGEPGGDIRGSKVVKNAEEILRRAKFVGKTFLR